MRSTTRLIFKGTLVLSLLVISLFCSSLPGFPRLTAQARPQAQTNWPEFGFDPQNSRYNPNETILTPSNVSGLTLAWIHQKQKSMTASPVVVNGVLYEGSQSGLYAFNATTGKLQWKAKVFVTDTPTVVGGIVYVGGAYDLVQAFDAKTGLPIWSYSTNGLAAIFSSPTVINGVLYIGIDNAMYALDALKGTLIWSNPLGLHQNPYSAPAVVGGVVYFGTQNAGYVYALDAQTGSLIWSDTLGSLNSSAAVVDGDLYIWDTSNVYALNVQTGAIIWTQSSFGVNYIYGSPAVANGVVYIESATKLYALDAQAGTVLWSYPVTISTHNNVYYCSPVVVNGFVYLTLDHNVYAFHLPGVTS